MLGRSAFWAGLIGLSLPAAAVAQGIHETARIMPPLSQYGSLQSPVLQTAGLRAPTRDVVTSAIAAAARAGTVAAMAEDVVRSASRAAAQGRAAATKAKAATQGYGALEIRFGSASCRYSGQVADRRASGFGVMICASGNFAGQFHDNAPDGLVVEQQRDDGYLGQYRNGMRNGLGGDYKIRQADAYEGEFKDGLRMGMGIERDKDGFYPGQFGFEPGRIEDRVDMEIFGLQNFPDTHWAGRYATYRGPRIACTLIKGALLEGSVLDGYGAKFDAAGRLIEQGLYRTGLLDKGAGPPC